MLNEFGYKERGNKEPDDDEDEAGENQKRKHESDDESSSEEYDEDEEVESGMDCSIEEISVSEEDESEEEVSSDKSQSKSVVPQNVHSEASDRSRPMTEMCAICLSQIKEDIGSPELCDHSFCLECLLEWAKSNNSCPQDRTQFLQIFVRKKVKGKIVRIIRVEEAKPSADPFEDDEEPTFCEVCGRCDREDTLLLCDGCDSGHHLECLDPPLSTVPIEEWFCPECESNGQTRMAHMVGIDDEELVELIEEGGLTTNTLPSQRTSAFRRPTRTRATERIRRRIVRARNARPNIIYSESDDSDSQSELDLRVSSSLGPPLKKRKIVKKTTRKRKTTVVKSIKKKTTKRKTTKRKSRTRSKRKKRTTKKKGSRKKRKQKTKNAKGKKKSMIPPVLTHKARLAEALGIRIPKNPWQLSVPAMTGLRGQGGEGWRASFPSLSLLGSNSELDYVSEPDEYGDAILAAGVRRRPLPTVCAAIARRKAITASTLISRSILIPKIDSKLSDRPVSDCSVSSGSDVLGNIIESQSLLHKTRQPDLNSKNLCRNFVELISKGGDGESGIQMGIGPNSNGNHNGVNSTPCRPQSSSQPYFGSNLNRSSGSFTSFSFGRTTSREDPTGSNAYSSYLRSYSNESTALSRMKKDSEKKRDKKEHEEDDINLYSDIEPEFPAGEVPDDDDDDDDDEEEDENYPKAEGSSQKESNQGNDSPDSDDELIIDDRQDGSYRGQQEHLPIEINTSGSTINDNEVGSSNLPGLNDFELEAVSDEDIHEMDKSVNSSISLSDSNLGEAEVSSSTHDNSKPPRQRNVSICEEGSAYNRRYNDVSSVGVGLGGLEMETISDNEEEMCFGEDNIEEGEIPSENPPRALPTNRPRINIQLRRVIEVSSPNKEFGDGEYEEGEIVDEAAARKKREKARKEVQEIVNPSGEEETPQSQNEDANKQVVASSPLALSDPDLSSPEKYEPVDKSTEKPLPLLMDREVDISQRDPKKPKEAVKESDISFKKVSRNTKVRNYRDSDGKEAARSKRRYSGEKGLKENCDRAIMKERFGSRERGHGRGRSREAMKSKGRGVNRDKDKNGNKERGRSRGRYKGSSHRDFEADQKREPKRKEMERYNVRQMINKKEEERKKKDEFGRDVSLRGGTRTSKSRSHSKSRRGSKRSPSRRSKRSPSNKKKSNLVRKKSYSRSPSKSMNKRRSYSTSSSSTSSSSTSSSSYSSSSSSSSATKRSRDKRRLRSRSTSKSLVKKSEKKKVPPVKTKEKKKNTSVPPKKKEEKKKEKPRKEKGEGMEKEGVPKVEKGKKKKKKLRDKSLLQSKEVFQAGGSIMVSVNFSRNKEKDIKKKKDKDDKIESDLSKRKKLPEKNVSSSYQSWSSGRMSMSPSGKHTPLQDEPMWSPGDIHGNRDIAPPKSPDDLDLDVIMVTPPPQEPILISDSEDDDDGITRLPPDLGLQPLSPLSRNQGGPKTPPEPGVKFTLSSKQVLKPINNPLQDEEEEDRSAVVVVASRGPNTPPGQPPESDESVGRPKSPAERIPRSPTGTTPTSSPEPDVYDPFEPTKSPSPLQRSPQQEARVSSSDQTELDQRSPAVDSSPVKAISPAPPPLPAEPPQSEEKPPEPQKAPEDEASSSVAATPSTVITSIAQIPISVSAPLALGVTKTTLALGVTKTTLPGVVPLSAAPTLLAPVITVHQPISTMQQIFAGLPANVASILYPAALAAVRGTTNPLIRPPLGAPILPPDFSRPPPTAALLSRPPPTTVSPMKVLDKTKVTQNGQGVAPMADVIDMDLGSPTSPDSSDASDIFDPPSPHSTHATEKTSPRKLARPFVQQKTSPVKSMKPVDKFEALFGDGRPKHHHKSKTHAKAKIKTLGKRIEINIDDDIPNSAVDLQVKEKLLKKVQRQERVVEEVKLCLKPFYNKKTITKEDYKEIMKKCVSKVCHNRSGEINPNKIRSLVEGYIRKVKYYRKKRGSSLPVAGPVFPPTASDPPPPGFGIMSKTHVKLKP